MPEIVLMCGKICSGKSSYARRYCREHNAVLLSSDEILLALFNQGEVADYSQHVANLKRYLYKKAAENYRNGISTVLDMGLWTKSGRKYARKFFQKANIPIEIHYIAISDEAWFRNISTRNMLVASNKYNAYFVTDGLLQKCQAIFEIPDSSEVDKIIEGTYA